MEKGIVLHSYTLRCYLEQPGGHIRMHVRQVQTGEERYFARVEDAIDYIKQQLEEAQLQRRGG